MKWVNAFLTPLKMPASSLKSIALSVVINLIVSSIFFAFLHCTTSQPQREIVTIDLLKIMEDYSAMVAKTLHSPDSIKKSAKALSQRLEEVIALNAKEKHLVIVPKQAVIQGAQDITPQIEQLVFGKPEAEK